MKHADGQPDMISQISTRFINTKANRQMQLGFWKMNYKLHIF